MIISPTRFITVSMRAGIHAQHVFRCGMGKAAGRRGFGRFIVLNLGAARALPAFTPAETAGGFRFDQDFQQVARRGLQHRRAFDGNVRDHGGHVAALADPVRGFRGGKRRLDGLAVFTRATLRT